MTYTDPFTAWALRWRIPPQALHELAALHVAPAATPGTESEARVSSIVRLEAGRKGVVLMRNNVGVGQREDGTPIRFGLMNDSAQINDRIKSSDLIGYRSIVITSADIGRRIAQFVARECKRPAWKYRPENKRDVAQARFIQMVASAGGDARFVQGEGSL